MKVVGINGSAVVLLYLALSSTPFNFRKGIAMNLKGLGYVINRT